MANAADDLLAEMRSMWGEHLWSQARRFAQTRTTISAQLAESHPEKDPRAYSPREIADALVSLQWTVAKFRRANY